jgi:glycosyltransferase involved in cell wall biosynthesis
MPAIASLTPPDSETAAAATAYAGGASPVRVLSIQSRVLGHTVYRRNMERAFAGFDRVRADFHFMDEDRELLTRIVCRLGEQRLPGGFVRERNLDLHRVRAEIGYGYMARRQIQRRLREAPYDVLHLHTQVAAYAADDLMRRIPTVVSGDITAALVATEATPPAFRWTHRPGVAREKRLFGLAAAVVMWSRWAADSLTNDLGIAAEKIHVIPPGTEVAAFPEVDPDARRDDRLPRLLFVGGQFRRKGGEDVLAVFADALVGRAELDIVTNDDVTSDLPGVRIHRGVAAFTPEWLRLYAEADLFVMPTYFDGLGIVYMEAAAAGLPVVATNINAVPEIVREGENGLLVRPGDRLALAAAIRALLDDPARRREMGRAGRRRAEREFDIDTNFRRFESVLVTAAGSPSERRTGTKTPQ